MHADLIEQSARSPRSKAMAGTAGSHNWRSQAACRGLDTSLFFPGQGESVSEAQAVCAGCVVRIDCSAYALESGQRFGIWGGTTERARRRLRAERRMVAQDGEVTAA